MTTGHPTFAELAHDLVRYRQGTVDQCERLDLVREAFGELIDRLADLVPDGPDATLAARTLHRACQDVVFSIVRDDRD